jgi:steroid delta-isomerase-like uncharacterized protein
MADPGDPQAILEAFYDAYNRGEPDSAVALYAPDATHSDVAQGRSASGRDAIASGLRHFLESFPDARWETERRIIDGADAAVAYRLTGTLQAQLGPFEPNGQKLDLRGVHVFRFGADGIVATEDYWDSGTFGRQMRG